MSAEEAVRKTIATVKDPQHDIRVVHSLQNFNANNNFMDLVFVCAGGNKVRTHKLLICSVSNPIKEILLGLPDTETVTILLPDVEARFLTLLIDFLYEGHIHVTPEQYHKFNEAKELLGIALSSNKTTKNPEGQAVMAPPSTPTQPPPGQLPPAQMSSAQPTYPQPTQFYYLPTTSNSQGQMQYVLAAPQTGMLPGPLLSPVSQGMTQPVSSQPIMIGQNGGQVVQAATQMVQQGSSQVVQMNNRLVAGSQMVNGPQLVQCSSEMVVQTSQPMVQPGSQPLVINNSQMQVGIQNQVMQSNQPVQQLPQYVMSSTTNSHTMGTQAQTIAQSRQPHRTPVQQIRTANRLQPQMQTNRVASMQLKSDQILSVLQENGAEELTAKEVRESLEKKLKVDLSNQEAFIEHVLNTSLICNDSLNEEPEIILGPTSSSSLPERTAPKNQNKEMKPRRRASKKPNEDKKKRLCFTNSDDERDEDFEPPKAKKSSKRRIN